MLTAGQVIGQAGVGGFLDHFEAPRESGWVCHPGVSKKSAEAVDCKRVVKTLGAKSAKSAIKREIEVRLEGTLRRGHLREQE